MVPVLSKLQAPLYQSLEDPCGLKVSQDLDHDLLVRSDLLDALDAHLDQLEIGRVQHDVRKLYSALVLVEVQPVLVVAFEDILDSKDDVILVVSRLHSVEEEHHGLQDVQAQLRPLDELIVH